MAASATPRNAEAPVVAVATSGGRDSIALLHATARAAAAMGLRAAALHVHHGLQPDADAWVARVRAQCRRWRARGLPVDFHWRQLEGRPSPGESVEAWARRGRYAALAEMARAAGASLVLLAHHRRDQAETFLLQALRGAGPAGLAAMPRLAQRDGLTWARPWLNASDAAIDAYAHRHRLRGVEDPSNADPAFARSRLRRDVMPALRAAFPDAELALANAAQRAHEARECLGEIAAADVAAIRDADGALVVARWQALPPARAALALRAWLHEAIGRGAPQTLVQRLSRELAAAGAARWPAPGGVLERHRGRLRLVPTPAAPAAPAVALQIARAGTVDVPAWGGRLRLRRVVAGGVALARLQRCELRPRTGGERFQCAPGATPRGLKKQFQAAGVAPSARAVPLLWADGELVAVPGLGVDARARAPAGVPQVAVEWIGPAPPAAARASGRRRSPR